MSLDDFIIPEEISPSKLPSGSGSIKPSAINSTPTLLLLTNKQYDRNTRKAVISHKARCKRCDREFVPRKIYAGASTRVTTYCSVSCSNAARGSRVRRNCNQCGITFRVFPSQIRKAGGKFCSHSCRTKWYNLHNNPCKSPLTIAERTITCIVCGTKVVVKPGRVTKRKFCSLHCHMVWQNRHTDILAKSIASAKKLRTGKDVNCIQCGKPFYVKRFYFNIAKFCSRKCKTDWERLNQVNIFSLRAALNRLTAFKGKRHTYETKKKMSAAHLGRLFSPEHKRNLSLAKTGQRASAETRKILSKAHMGNKNRLGIPHSPEIKARIRESTRKFFFEHPERHAQYIFANHQDHGIGYISKGQIDLFLKTKKIFSEALLNQPIKTRSGNLYYGDIVIPSVKIVVEYDGTYWHKDKDRDRRRDFNLEADGWKVIHVIDTKADSFDPNTISMA